MCVWGEHPNGRVHRRGPPVRTAMDLGTDVTRRLCVRTRIRQSMALPMDLRTVVSVRPDVRGRVRQSMALPMDWHGGAGWGRGAVL